MPAVAAKRRAVSGPCGNRDRGLGCRLGVEMFLKGLRGPGLWMFKSFIAFRLGLTNIWITVGGFAFYICDTVKRKNKKESGEQRGSGTMFQNF